MATRKFNVAVQINRDYQGTPDEILLAGVPNAKGNLDNGWSLIDWDFGESIRTEDGRRITTVTLTFQHDSDDANWLTR